MTNPKISANQQNINYCQSVGCVLSAGTKNLCEKHYRRQLRANKNRFSKTSTVDELSTRFWARVALTANPNKCWLWTGWHDGNNYGVIQHNNRRYNATHVAWMFTYGAFPTECLLHSCDNPPCVNPNHLREGSRRENVQDMVNKNRQAKGEQAGSKLTEKDVRIIRRLLATKKLMQKEIAAIFDIDRSLISVINSGKIWRHVT